MLTHVDYSKALPEGFEIVTVRRGNTEIAELLKARNGQWFLWKTLNPVWSSLELRELATKLDELNSGVNHAVQVPISSGVT